MTDENQDREKARATNVKATLESKLLQDTLGSNQVLTDQSIYGTLGTQSAQESYNQATSNEDFNKARQQIYEEKKQEMEQIGGVYGEPSIPSNTDVSMKLIRQLKEVMAMAQLGELEKHAKDVGAKLDFEVPEKLKKYSQMNLMQKAVDGNKINPDKLNDEEKDALQVYQILTQAYDRACAVKASQANYFADMNEVGKTIAEKYASKKQSK